MTAESNAYVERFHRTLGQECLQVHLPRTREQVQQATESFLAHYNDERPNQARSCGNQPPRVACPQFPALPVVPEAVDPDCWLGRVQHRTFARTVQADGGVRIDHREYYVGRALAGHRVTCVVQAARQQFDIWHGTSWIKQLPIKGLHGTPLPFEEYVTLMKHAQNIDAISRHVPDGIKAASGPKRRRSRPAKAPTLKITSRHIVIGSRSVFSSSVGSSNGHQEQS